METDIVFKACMRPAMMFGVPMLPCMIVSMIFIICAVVFSMWVLVLHISLHLLMASKTRQDELYLSLLGVRIATLYQTLKVHKTPQGFTAFSSINTSEMLDLARHEFKT